MLSFAAARLSLQESTNSSTNDVKVLIEEAHEGLLGNSVAGLSDISPYHQMLVLISHLSGSLTPQQASEFARVVPVGKSVVARRKRQRSPSDGSDGEEETAGQYRVRRCRRRHRRRKQRGTTCSEWRN